MNTYDLIADIYEQTIDHYLYKVYLRLIEKRSAGGAFLEIGCGTAHLAKKCAPMFDTVHAFDASAAMIEKAGQKPVPTNVKLFVHDMARPLDRTYDMIIAPIDVFNHTPDFENLRTLFTRWTAHLRKDGHFIFDMLRCDYVKRLPGYAETLDTPKGVYHWSVKGTTDPRRIIHEISHKKRTARHEETCYKDEEVRTLFAGFKLLETIRMEERVLYVLQK